MIFLFFIFSSSIYVGLDIGSYFSKASQYENSEPPSIILYKKNSPNTPSFIAFRARPNFNLKSEKPLSSDEIGQLYLLFGESALRAMEYRPWMGTGFFPLLCNLNKSSSNEYTNPFHFNSSAARIPFEDLLILFLKTYIDSITNDATKIEEICFVFPATFTNPQREIFEFALNNIGIKQFHNIDDVNAISNVYAIEQFDRFENHPKTVLFIDIGGLSIKAYSVRFLYDKGRKLPQAHRLSYTIDRKQGGAHLTRKIVDYIRNSLGINNLSDSEYRRLFGAAEKLKIELSTEKKSTVIVEDIKNIDRQISLNQSELSDLMDDLINDIFDLTDKNVEFDEIEIIGGASKSQLLIEKLQEKFKKEVRQSLNPESSLSIGASYSLSFRHNDKFVPLSIEDDHSIYTIKCTTLNGTFPVCEKAKKCSTKLNLPHDAQLALFTYSDDEIQPGQLVSAFGFYLDYIKEGSIVIRLKHCPLRIHSAHSCISNKCKKQNLETMDPPKLFSQIYAMYTNSSLRNQRLNQTRDELITFTSRVLSEVEKNQTFRFFSNYSQRIAIIRCAEAQRKWLLSKKDQVTDPINFTSRLNELKKVVYPVYRRIYENTTLFIEMGKLYQTIEHGKFGLNVFWPTNRTYVDPDVIKRFEVLLQETENFLNETISTILNSPGWKSFPVKANEVKEINEKLELKFNEIQLQRPPPTAENPNPKLDLPPEYYQQFQNSHNNEYQKEREIGTFDQFLESKKEPYSTDDL